MTGRRKAMGCFANPFAAVPPCATYCFRLLLKLCLYLSAASGECSLLHWRGWRLNRACFPRECHSLSVELCPCCCSSLWRWCFDCFQVDEAQTASGSFTEWILYWNHHIWHFSWTNVPSSQELKDFSQPSSVKGWVIGTNVQKISVIPNRCREPKRETDTCYEHDQKSVRLSLQVHTYHVQFKSMSHKTLACAGAPQSLTLNKLTDRVWDRELLSFYEKELNTLEKCFCNHFKWLHKFHSDLTQGLRSTCLD